MKDNRKSWNQQEDEAIIALVRKYGNKRWTLISQKMRQKFPDQGRSGKQCRQRWHNHLSPAISKQPWTDQQLRDVFEAHRNHGNKWTEISALLPGRTDNSIKNQFYSTLRKGLRRICKVLGTRNSTTQIKRIKPSALSALMSNISQSQDQIIIHDKDLYETLIDFSNDAKYQSIKQKPVTEEEKLKLESLLEKILDSKDIGRKKKGRTRNKSKSLKFIETQNYNKQVLVNIKKESIQNQKKVENEKISTKQQKNQNEQIENNEEHQLQLDFELDLPDILPLYKRDKSLSVKLQNNAKNYSENGYHFNLAKKDSSLSHSSQKNKRGQENDQNNFCCFLSVSPLSQQKQMFMPVIYPTPHTWENNKINLLNAGHVHGEQNAIEQNQRQMERILLQKKRQIDLNLSGRRRKRPY